MFSPISGDLLDRGLINHSESLTKQALQGAVPQGPDHTWMVPSSPTMAMLMTTR